MPGKGDGMAWLSAVSSMVRKRRPGGCGFVRETTGHGAHDL